MCFKSSAKSPILQDIEQTPNTSGVNDPAYVKVTRGHFKISGDRYALLHHRGMQWSLSSHEHSLHGAALTPILIQQQFFLWLSTSSCGSQEDSAAFAPSAAPCCCHLAPLSHIAMLGENDMEREAEGTELASLSPASYLEIISSLLPARSWMLTV